VRQDCPAPSSAEAGASASPATASSPGTAEAALRRPYMRRARILVPISIGLVGLGLFIYEDRAGDGLLRAIGRVVIVIAALISTFWRAPRR